MSFEVPTYFRPEYYQLTVRRAELLIKTNILDIKHLTLQQWLNNFSDIRAQYLAAHLLDAMVYRSDDMIKSMLRHLIEMELPLALEEKGYDISGSMNAFLSSLSNGSTSCPIRFVALDGGFDKTPGKSGGIIIRHLREAGLIHKNISIRPESIAKTDPEKLKGVRYLVMVDDFVGTGTQFDKFAKHYNIESWAEQYAVIYLSFMAHDHGINTIKKNFPYVALRTGEKLSAANNFFAPSLSDTNKWGRDNFNRLIDVKDYYSKLLIRGGIKKPLGEFDLGLTVVTSLSVPNNTLKAFWASDGSWKPLRSR